MKCNFYTRYNSKGMKEKIVHRRALRTTIGNVWMETTHNKVI